MTVLIDTKDIDAIMMPKNLLIGTVYSIIVGITIGKAL
jgi:hypothetical protein